jgi:hypothetical protein
VINQVGNKAINDQNSLLHAVSIGGIVAILAFIQYFLRPFGKEGD